MARHKTVVTPDGQTQAEISGDELAEIEAQSPSCRDRLVGVERSDNERRAKSISSCPARLSGDRRHR